MTLTVAYLAERVRTVETAWRMFTNRPFKPGEWLVSINVEDKADILMDPMILEYGSHDPNAVGDSILGVDVVVDPRVAPGEVGIYRRIA